MNIITDHLDLWSSTVKAKKSVGRGSGKKRELYGVKKLRELILELAVRGLLVEQDPDDEPASELLNKIANEKAKLVKDGTIKKLKPSLPIPDHYNPFAVPVGWEYTRVGNLFDVVYGKGLPNSKLTETGFKVFGANGIIGHYTEYLYEATQLLISCRGAYSGKPNISPTMCYVTSNSLVLRNTWKNLNLRYFYYALTSADKSDIVTGSAQPQVTTTNLDPFIVLLPPLAEQHRIVAKVDELMALCDQLEQQQEDSIDTHETLVKTLLDALTTTSDPAQFQQAWQRIEAHFHLLFTTDSSIDHLKQTILQLAVMGKLVEQDPKDEPAEELLKKIAVEKEQRIKEKKILKQKPLTAIAKEEEPFKLCAGWEWRRFEDLVDIRSGITKGKKLSGRETILVPYLSVANVQRSYLNLQKIKEVEIPIEEENKYQVQDRDLLITEGGDWDKVGRTAIWRNELPYVAHQNHVFKARVFIPDQCEIWLEKYLNSSFCRNYFAGSSKQTTNLASINKTQLRGCLIAVPPKEEQHRIVAKVDELMTLCDTLKAKLQTAQTTQQTLTDTIVQVPSNHQ